MFSAKTISDRICGLIYIARFTNIIHLILNRPTKIAVCAPGLSVDFTVRWTDEDNYIIYIENNTWCAEIALYKAL
jgi:hypothetical protein